jgi:outer membrane protein OmpA-like peptidoglycan-associated protein
MTKFYKQKFLLLLFLLGPVGLALAQDFLPTLSDNYMGINQVILQPASISDSRFKIDINVFGVNSDIYNDALRLRSKFILNPSGYRTNENWWSENTYLDNPDGLDKHMFSSQSVLGPSFMISLPHSQAIGFTSRVRSITNVDGISEPLIRTVQSDYTDEKYWNQWIFDDHMRAVQHVFADYGLTYAGVLFNNGAHVLKAGVTVKLLQGIAASYIQSDSLYYYFDGANNDGDYPMSYNATRISSGLSDNWGDYDDAGMYDYSMNFQYTSKPSAGLDVGFVYEFRPKYMDYRYDMDGEKNLERNDKNKYLLKIGASIVDIGRLKYKKDYNSFDFAANFTPDYAERFTNGDNSVPDSTYWLNAEVGSFSFQKYVNFVDTMYQRELSGYGVEKAPGNDDKFMVTLPTALSLQIDVRVVEGFYVNLTSFTGLNQGYSRVPNSHYMSNYSITPRYERKWFTISMPFQYNQFQKMNVGLGVRAGFVYAGVTNLFSGLIKDPYGTNVYLGVKIPLFKEGPPSDKDNDGVSDEKDVCPDVPGPWEFYGCPDRDGDGVSDSEDLCPDIAGKKEFLGCPDTDGDGVSDKDDECPKVPGPKITNGCPDRDNDGIVDSKDNCPDLAGLAEYAGCPFLDTDGDGVKDADDMCPDKKGPPENNGCPYSDSDRDGVIDKDDRCPLTPGDPANFGCPILAVEEVAILNTAFQNLEFETAKAVIRSSSFASMDELARLLISKPTYKLKISGHTDNVGTDAYNMGLSKNRAQSTANYLTGKGVPLNQLLVEWFGESMPIADNNTADGRQTNRRVEMQVVFD